VNRSKTLHFLVCIITSDKICLVQSYQSKFTHSFIFSLLVEAFGKGVTVTNIMRQPKQLVVILIFLFSIFIPSCGWIGTKSKCSPPPSYNTAEQYSSPSKRLKVHIYLDGTESMKGFIVAGKSSRYQQILPLLESAVLRGWKDANVVFSKFGTSITELPERSYLKAQSTEFYADPNINKKTFIQEVIKQAHPDNLTIIITDLFQQDADVNQITEGVKAKYINGNLAVGVLGCKSEFKGKIFDVGPKAYTFEYDSYDDAKRFRPFYVLALGKHSDISNYFDYVLKDGSFLSEPQPLIFSRHFAEKLVSFNGATITEISKMAEVENLIPIDVKDNRVKQFSIKNSSDVNGSFSIPLDFKALPYTIPIKPQELKPEISVFKCGTEQNPNADQNNEAEAVRGLNIKANLNESKIDLKADVVPTNLPDIGIYGFQIILRPSNYQMPDWVINWNMDGGKVEEWRTSPNDFNGATTYNLKPFLTNLWENTLQIHNPKVAELYCYIKKE